MTLQLLRYRDGQWHPALGGGLPFDVAAFPAWELGYVKPEVGVYTGAGADYFQLPEPGWAGTLTGVINVGPTDVLDGYIIDGRVTGAGGGRMRNCVVRGGAAEMTGVKWLVNTAGASASNPFVIENCTLRPTNPSAYMNGIGPRFFLDINNDISGVVDCVNVQPSASGGPTNAYSYGTYMHDMSRFAPDYANNNRRETHNDAVQLQLSGVGYEAIGNWIAGTLDPVLGTQPVEQIQKAAVMINQAPTDLLLRRNWFDNGDFCINGGGATGGVVRIEENRFDRTARQWQNTTETYAVVLDASVDWGQDPQNGKGNGTFFGNVYADNGQAVVVRNG